MVLANKREYCWHKVMLANVSNSVGVGVEGVEVGVKVVGAYSH